MTLPETSKALPSVEPDQPTGQAGATPKPRRRPRPAGVRARRRPSRTEAFLAVMEERMANLEQQLNELKGRVNGLIFLIVGAAAAQFILRLMG